MLKRGLFVGRFQPFHKGHLNAVKFILKQVEELILVVGSAQHSHDSVNPFTTGERIYMVRLAFKESKIDLNTHIIVPVPDVTLHSTWFSSLLSYVPRFDVVFSNEPLTRRLTKEAGYRVEYVPLIRRDIYWATEIRKRMLSGDNWEKLVPKSVADFINLQDGVQRIKDLMQSDKMIDD